MNYLFLRLGGKNCYCYFNQDFQICNIVHESNLSTHIFTQEDYKKAQIQIDQYATKRAKELLLQ